MQKRNQTIIKDLKVYSLVVVTVLCLGKMLTIGESKRSVYGNSYTHGN